ncbi:MAG: ubiquitin-specific protease ubp2 [Piccolia ochrophora]|nr:MAG: ubiquitin-specific protease ubp2 [Piccolia ochrophora]
MSMKSGKTAPYLIELILRHDPAKLGGDDVDIFSAPLPTFFASEPTGPDPATRACRHTYVLKPLQCELPHVDSRPDESTRYEVAAFCSTCRCHINLVVTYRSFKSCKRPCPSHEYPLHHLVYAAGRSTPRQRSTENGAAEDWTDRHCFECTSPTCSAKVTVAVKPPRLGREYTSLLTDQSQIRQRAEREINRHPELSRPIAIPEPLTVLKHLKVYITDALNTGLDKKFPANNKFFLTSLGESCRGLLQHLGFRYVELEEQGEIRPYWNLPKVIQHSEDPVYREASSTLLDDVEKELMVLIEQRPFEEKQRVKVTLDFLSTPALKELERCLGSLDYDKITAPRRIIDLTADADPSYAGLGSLGDFSDKLLIFAYGRQVSVDSGNASYYFDCLHTITEQRKSEQLETKVAMMESSGQVGMKDLRRAYEYFGLDINDKTLQDDHIIGVFHSRVSDAPRQEEDMRQHLRVIGMARQSDTIKAVASNKLSTYEDALTWLGIEDTTDDEWVLSYLTIRLGEKNADLETGRKAIALIAEKRDSALLRRWLLTGSSEDTTMDIGQAYARLGIEDRTVDDEIIVTTFQIRSAEAPAQSDELRSALQAIARETGSSRIMSFLDTGQTSGKPSSERPVGLENIGNTCYLNSLLQFYFTIKPLRDLLLSFTTFESEITSESIKNKRVGSRRVSLKEVERAKKFAFELQGLFKSLISAQSTSITPARELARLTLIKSSDEEVYRRKSITSIQERPSLGEINGAPVQGPSGPPGVLGAMDLDTELVNDQHIDNGSSDSEKTLVEKLPAYNSADTTMQGTIEEKWKPDNESGEFFNAEEGGKQKQQQIFEDKENLPPSKQELIESPSAHGQGEPLEESSPSKVNEQPLHTARNREHDGEEDTLMINGVPPTPPPEIIAPPDRPPPVPPRPQLVEEKRAIDELELGAQQDVTEVIGNVMFQLECAMRPLGVDDMGEQLDEIKQLFYGKLRTHTEAESAHRTTEEYFADIKVNVASGPRDIYAALDGAFDMQEVILKDGTFPQYASISHLPPILQIQVQRVQYDVEKKRSYKSDAHLTLRDTIYLDRYMESQDLTLLRRRQELWTWKDKLRRLEARRDVLARTAVNMDVSEMLRLTRTWVEEFVSQTGEDKAEVEPLCEDLTRRAEEAKAELDDIEASIGRLNEKIEGQFLDLRNLTYRLQAVFIHRGTATFGHYWIYIYDFTRKVWRKYNDGYVTEVKDEKEIYEQEPHYPATPYYLVYVRDQDKDDLVDPVCRDVPPHEELPWSLPPEISVTDEGTDSNVQW